MLPIIENEIEDIYRKLYDRGLNSDQIVDIRERLYAIHRLLVASEDSWPVKVCSCGRQHMVQDWLQLPLVGYQSFTTIGGELRNCVCGSTMIFTRRQTFSTPAPILRHTILDNKGGGDTRPPFSLQQCMNITLAYTKMKNHIYLDKWSDMQVLEGALFGQTPECNL